MSARNFRIARLLTWGTIIFLADGVDDFSFEKKRPDEGIVYATEGVPFEWPQIYVEPKEFCLGCTATVTLFSLAGNMKFLESQKATFFEKEFDIYALIKEMCGNSFFNNYEPFLSHSCLKLQREYSTELASAFPGDTLAVFELSKGDIFDRVEKVTMSCLHI
jgi:hypothetical protein